MKEEDGTRRIPIATTPGENKNDAVHQMNGIAFFNYL